MFRPIDERPFEYSPVQAGLLLLRALAHEISKKEVSKAVAGFLRDRTDHPGLADDLELGSSWAHAAMLQHLDLIQEAILKHRVDEIKFDAFLSHAPPPLVSSIVWFPDFTLDGKRIQSLPQSDHLPGLLGIFSLPHPEGSICVLTWHKSSQWCVSKLFNSIARTRHADEIGDSLLQLQMTIAENVYFMPDWWEGLSQKVKEEYFKWWAIQADMTASPDPDQAQRLRNPELRWEMSYVRRS